METVIHGISHGVGCGVRHGVDRLEVSHVAGLRVSSVMESVIGSVSDVNQVLKVTICVKILNRLRLRNRRCVGSGI